MMKTALAVLAALCVATLALAKYQSSALPNFEYWSAKELRGYEQPLHDKVAGVTKSSGIKLADYGASNVSIPGSSSPTS